METLIFRWSTIVQLTSVALIAVFFIALTRSVRLADLRWWILAWIANVVALAVAVSFWLLQPQSPLVISMLRGLYMGGKTAFVVFLVLGAWALQRPGRQPVGLPAASLGIAIYALIGTFAVSGVALLGVVQQGVLGVLFTVGVLVLVRGPDRGGMRWLLTGFAIRAALSFVESAAYSVQLLPERTVEPELAALAGTFAAAHSAFDSGTEWLIALGCVLAITDRTQRELRQYNDDLLDAQAELRQIADRDPLTGLANRRTLRTALSEVREAGATLLFFDLDDFKQVNDLHGHQVGDECLRRFSNALRTCFRPQDVLVRYAGDEFLVVARALDRETIGRRLQRLREVLEGERGSGPGIGFSVGVGELEPGGQPEAALEAADAAMYRAKGEARDDRRRRARR